MPQQFECSLTGETAVGTEVPSADDNLGDLPIGWVQIAITRRAFNPKWIAIQAAKERMLKTLLASEQGDITSEIEEFHELQVESQWGALEERTPMYVLDVQEVLHLSSNRDIVDILNDARSALGAKEAIPPAPFIEGDVDDDGEPGPEETPGSESPEPEPQE